MRKIILGIISCIAVTGIVTGCSSQKETNDVKIESDHMEQEKKEENQEENKEADSKEEEQIQIGFSQSGSVSEWKEAITASIKDTFTEENGYILWIEDAEEDQEQQFTAIRSFVDRGVDYIVAAPCGESEQWETVLNEAKQAEIPVILIRNQIEIEDKQLYIAWIGSDYLQEGYDAGDWLEEYLEGKDSDIRIAMVEDLKESQTIQQRFQGLLEQRALSKLENWKIYDNNGNLQKEPNAELGLSIEKTAEMLKADDNIDVLICGNDEAALKLLEVLEDTGKTYGEDGDIAVISFGASKAVLEAVKDGKINVEIEQNLSYGSYIEEVVKRHSTGDEIDKIQYSMEGIFTKENVEEKLRSMK